MTEETIPASESAGGGAVASTASNEIILRVESQLTGTDSMLTFTTDSFALILCYDADNKVLYWKRDIDSGYGDDTALEKIDDVYLRRKGAETDFSFNYDSTYHFYLSEDDTHSIFLDIESNGKTDTKHFYISDDIQVSGGSFNYNIGEHFGGLVKPVPKEVDVPQPDPKATETDNSTVTTTTKKPKASKTSKNTTTPKGEKTASATTSKGGGADGSKSEPPGSDADSEKQTPKITTTVADNTHDNKPADKDGGGSGFGPVIAVVVCIAFLAAGTYFIDKKLGLGIFGKKQKPIEQQQPPPKPGNVPGNGSGQPETEGWITGKPGNQSFYKLDGSISGKVQAFRLFKGDEPTIKNFKEWKWLNNIYRGNIIVRYNPNDGTQLRVTDKKANPVSYAEFFGYVDNGDLPNELYILSFDNGKVRFEPYLTKSLSSLLEDMNNYLDAGIMVNKMNEFMLVRKFIMEIAKEYHENGWQAPKVIIDTETEIQKYRQNEQPAFFSKAENKADIYELIVMLMNYWLCCKYLKKQLGKQEINKFQDVLSVISEHGSGGQTAQPVQSQTGNAAAANNTGNAGGQPAAPFNFGGGNTTAPPSGGEAAGTGEVKPKVFRPRKGRDNADAQAQQNAPAGVQQNSPGGAQFNAPGGAQQNVSQPQNGQRMTSYDPNQSIPQPHPPVPAKPTAPPQKPPVPQPIQQHTPVQPSQPPVQPPVQQAPVQPPQPPVQQPVPQAPVQPSQPPMQQPVPQAPAQPPEPPQPAPVPDDTIRFDRLAELVKADPSFICLDGSANVGSGENVLLQLKKKKQYHDIVNFVAKGDQLYPNPEALGGNINPNQFKELQLCFDCASAVISVIKPARIREEGPGLYLLVERGRITG